MGKLNHVLLIRAVLFWAHSVDWLHHWNCETSDRRPQFWGGFVPQLDYYDIVYVHDFDGLHIVNYHFNYRQWAVELACILFIVPEFHLTKGGLMMFIYVTFSHAPSVRPHYCQLPLENPESKYDSLIATMWPRYLSSTRAWHNARRKNCRPYLPITSQLSASRNIESLLLQLLRPDTLSTANDVHHWRSFVTTRRNEASTERKWLRWRRLQRRGKRFVSWLNGIYVPHGLAFKKHNFMLFLFWLHYRCEEDDTGEASARRKRRGVSC